MILRTLAILSALSGPALAVSCPPEVGGRPIARNDGGLLYVGDPAWRVLLAPDKPARSMADTNEWRPASTTALTLVCSYEGGKRVAYSLLAGSVSRCVQTLATGAFACR